MNKSTLAMVAILLFSIVTTQSHAAPVCTNHDLDWSQYPQFNDDVNTVYPFTATAVDIDGSPLDVSVRMERAANDFVHVNAPNTTFPGVVDVYMNNPEVYRYWKPMDNIVDTLTFDFSEDITMNLFMFGGHRPTAGNFAYAELTFWDGPNGTGNKVISQHASGADSAVVLNAVGDPTTAAINVLPLSQESNYASTFLSTTNSYTMVTYDVGFSPRPWTVLDMGGAVVRSMTWSIYGSDVDVSPQLPGSGSNGDGSRDVSVPRASVLTMDISAYVGNFNFDVCENNEMLSLGDYVWYDSNRDGIQDGSELGINGVTVNLYSNPTCTAPISDTTTTINNGGDGFYEFNPLSTGDYCVEFVAPAGHTISPTGQGTAATDSDANPITGQVQNIDLHAIDLTIDMGVFIPGSVSGLVWCESGTNPNTVYDAADADTLQSNIEVTLFEDTNCNNALDGAEAGTALSQDTVAGNYSFTNLITGGPGAGNNPPGCYLVQIDATDPDLSNCDNPITPPLLAPDIDAQNPNNTDNNFGHDEQLSLGDYVWYDSNQDGIQGIDEPGVNNITVDLYTSSDCSGVISQTTTTTNGGVPAADGWYNFGALASGNYCLRFSALPAGWVVTQQDQGLDEQDSDVDPNSIEIQNINLSTNDPTLDMGIYAAIGSISGQMFCDYNPGNGVYDAGEETADITIDLFRDDNCDGVGDNLYETTETGSDGNYSFINLPVGYSPTPPNPRSCYVVRYFSSDPDLADCNTPLFPEEEGVELTTDTPVSPPVIFATIPLSLPPPENIPTNNFWGLLLLFMLLIFYSRKQQLR